MLTIAYCTARLDPKIEWMLDSLAVETAGDFSQIQIVIIDYHANPFGGRQAQHEERREYITRAIDHAGIPHENFTWSAPKSNPWQGKHRQTRDDWFNVANSRNTAICLADGEWILFLDDLSVLQPGYYAAACQAAQNPKCITLGAYRKVNELVVKDGVIVSCKGNITDSGFDAGMDSRRKHAPGDKVKMNCPPEWHFGYVMGPLQAYLDVNGWVETDTAGLSFEDVPTGINLGKKGYSFRYDPRMMAYESDELHGIGKGMKKADYGVSPKDKSHAVLDRARGGDGWAQNDFFNGMTLAGLRDHVHARASNAFPAPPAAYREWFTGQLLSELD